MIALHIEQHIKKRVRVRVRCTHCVLGCVVLGEICIMPVLGSSELRREQPEELHAVKCSAA